MPRSGRLLLVALVMGTVASVVGIALTAAFSWFFRGELGLSRDTVLRLVVVGFVVGLMPVGLLWARSRKEKP